METSATLPKPAKETSKILILEGPNFDFHKEELCPSWILHCWWFKNPRSGMYTNLLSNNGRFMDTHGSTALAFLRCRTSSINSMFDDSCPNAISIFCIHWLVVDSIKLQIAPNWIWKIRKCTISNRSVHPICLHHSSVPVWCLCY